jgi:hypothetical protein
VLVLLLLAWFVVPRFGNEPSGPGRLPTDPGASTAAPSPPTKDGIRSQIEDGVRLTGRVTDASGRPWVDLTVAGGGQHVRTDAGGGFVLVGLERSEVVLDLTSDFDAAEPLGVRRLACALPPERLDLADAPEVFDAGTFVVPRSQPFWVEGEIVLDLDWASSKGITLAEVRVEILAPQPEDLGSHWEAEITPAPEAKHDWTRPPWRHELPGSPPIGPDGRFRFAVETPHAPFLLRLWLRRLEPFERVVLPTPAGRFQETYEWP